MTKYELQKDLIDFNSQRIAAGTIFFEDGQFYTCKERQFKISTARLSEFADFFKQIAHNDE